MKKAKIILSAVCLFAVGLTATQAQQYKHEVSLGAGGGISSLQYKLTEGDHKIGWGGNMELGYAFFLNPNWGLRTGVELALYRGSATLNTPDNANIQTLSNGDRILTYFNGMEEKQKATMLNIPVMVQYQTSTRHKFYAMAGVKFGIPMKSTFSNTDGSYDVNIHYTELGDFPHAGVGPQTDFGKLGIYDNHKYNGTSNDLSLKLSIMGSLETGVKWQLSDRWALYTGIFLDYGFNDIYDGSRDKALFTFDPDFENTGVVNKGTNSIVASTYTNADGQTEKYSDKLSNLACGLKIRFSFGLGTKIAERPAAEDADLSPEVKAQVEAANAQKAAADKAAQAADAQKAAADALKAAADKELEAAEKAMAAADSIIKASQRRQGGISASEMAVYGGVIDNYPTGTYMPLTAEQQANADAKIALLKSDPNTKATLVGHTCNLGTKAGNYQLALKRAEAVKAYMVSKGIAADRLTVVSKGDTEPKFANDTDAHRRLNRRVEVIPYR